MNTSYTSISTGAKAKLINPVEGSTFLSHHHGRISKNVRVANDLQQYSGEKKVQWWPVKSPKIAIANYGEETNDEETPGEPEKNT